MQTRNGLFSDVQESDWNNWHWQVEHRITTLEGLEDCGIVIANDERVGGGNIRKSAYGCYTVLSFIN